MLDQWFTFDSFYILINAQNLVRLGLEKKTNSWSIKTKKAKKKTIFSSLDLTHNVWKSTNACRNQLKMIQNIGSQLVTLGSWLVDKKNIKNG